jgi:hypothetical protein
MNGCIIYNRRVLENIERRVTMFLKKIEGLGGGTLLVVGMILTVVGLFSLGLVAFKVSLLLVAVGMALVAGGLLKIA